MDNYRMIRRFKDLDHINDDFYAIQKFSRSWWLFWLGPHWHIISIIPQYDGIGCTRWGDEKSCRNILNHIKFNSREWKYEEIGGLG